jgi:hemolysin activation/secretion protein
VDNRTFIRVILIIGLIASCGSNIFAQDNVFFDMEDQLSDRPPSFLDHLPPTAPKQQSHISGMPDIPVRKFRIQGNALFSGYDENMRSILAMYRISNDAINRWKEAGIPASVTITLEKLIDRSFIDEDQFRQSLKSILTNNDYLMYENFIVKHASIYTDNRISPESLHDVKRRLTTYYQKRGYINSLAIIPDQEVIDGIIRIQVIEGRLTAIKIFDNHHVSNSYIYARLLPVMEKKGRILNVYELEKSLQECIPLLTRNSRIDKINVRLIPGISMGEATLEIHIKEARMMQIKLEANNHQSPGIGSYCGEVGFRHLNPLGFGDSIHLQYGMTEGLDDMAFNYLFPINTRAYLTFTADQSESVIIVPPYDQFDLTNKVTRFSMGITWPFFQNLAHEFSMTIRMERLHGETLFEGDPFPLDGADENGESDLSIAHCIHEWIHRSKDQVLGIRSTASFGLDAFDATINESGPDGRFATWLIQAQYLRHLDFLDSEIIARLDVRYSNKQLMPSQKFALGGAQSVRGYRENRITSDDGQLFSLQFQKPLTRLPLFGLSKTSEDGYLVGACFFDYGNAHNVDGNNPAPNNISSIGTGLHWHISPEIVAKIYWAYALRDLEKPEKSDIQDDGIHFQVQMVVY